ncbi:MAG TPA: precorrin-3B C(17)-methyltransferase, partial [Cyanobacteria bacterium UBA9579]|nr:precorrin-3B C(17)-methyltransferase [Cyanobacteria bacterium UBA9579]
MSKGEIYIISTGTGNVQQLTGNACELLGKADLIVGY